MTDARAQEALARQPSMLEKISKQATHLFRLNSELQQSKDYIDECEARIGDLENAIYSQPPTVRAKVLGNTQGSKSGDAAYTSLKRERELTNQIETLTQQLESAEIRLQDKENITRIRSNDMNKIATEAAQQREVIETLRSEK